MPVFSLRSTTLAPGTTEPEASLTATVIVPVSSWAGEAMANSGMTAMAASRKGFRCELLNRQSCYRKTHADHPEQPVQRTPLSGRGDCSVRALVPAISVGLRTRLRDFGGARRRGGCQLHLALGPSLCAGVE